MPLWLNTTTETTSEFQEAAMDDGSAAGVLCSRSRSIIWLGPGDAAVKVQNQEEIFGIGDLFRRKEPEGSAKQTNRWEP